MPFPRFNKFIPYISLGVATAAFAFQTTVLYPWHHELDHAFHRLKEEQTRLLAEYHTEKLKRIDALETKMMAVETRQDKMQR